MIGGFFKKRVFGNKGFTLIEILVALAMLGIIIVPVIGMFSASSQSNHRSERNTVALTVARDIMDRIKAGDIDQDNLQQEINNHKSQHNVEILVLLNDEEDNLQGVKVYVTPSEDMDPQTEGIMLASYSASVFTASIDTSGMEELEDGGGD